MPSSLASEQKEELEEYSWHRKVTAEEAGQRLDVWLTSVWSDKSRAEIRRALVKGCFWVGEKPGKPSTITAEGDEVRGKLQGAFQERKTSWTPQKMPLDILYEDSHLLVIHKPAGIVSHPGAGTKQPTLIEGVMAYLGTPEDDSELSSFRYGLVHRLDKDTSGALVIAKDSFSHRSLSQQFAKKTTSREYITLLDGLLPQATVDLETYLHRNPHHRTLYKSTDRRLCESRHPEGVPRGYRLARSKFTRQLRFAQRFDLCSVLLSTGRTHQIRVHAHSLNCPVLGDKNYHRGKRCNIQKFFQELGEDREPLKRQMLHARTLGFKHPHRNEFISVSAPLPKDFRNLIRDLRPYGELLSPHPI